MERERIDAYLDRLCADLKVEPLRRDDIRLEVHAHLRQRVDTLIQGGMTPEAAERRAVEEFGDPLEVAMQLSSIPIPTVLHPHGLHVERVGIFFAAHSLFFYLYGLVDYLTSRRSADLFTLESILHVLLILLFLFAHLCIGVNLARRKTWPRIYIAGYAIFYVLSFMWYLLPLADSLHSASSFQLWIRFPGAVLGSYALWTLLHPNRRYVERVKNE